MHLSIGQKVAYPAQGICVVEGTDSRKFGDRSVFGYVLRLASDNSLIFVPIENADNVGLRPILKPSQCRKLIGKLGDDFGPISCDWKARSREFMAKIQSGDVFQAADVFKKLTFLSHEKRLSFREQNLLEKAKFLLVSELSNASPNQQTAFETKIVGLAESACAKHQFLMLATVAAS